jgi:L-alanine-DL-glutamate epimerase-like enolase superfamily enzyme
MPMKQSLRDMIDANGDIHVPAGPGLSVDIKWDLARNSCVSHHPFSA